MTQAELDLGRAKARETLTRLVGWQASLIKDEQIDHVIQVVVEAIDDYRKSKEKSDG